MREAAVIALLALTACPDKQPEYGWQDDPNGGHPVEYRAAPSGDGIWRNLASGGAGYLLGRMHGRSREERPAQPSYQPPPTPAPQPSYQPPAQRWHTPPPAPRPSGSYSVPSRPSYSAPSRPSYSRPSSSGGARGRYSR